MGKKTTITEAPVAVQKWFEGGEGWAYHPSLKNQMQSIVESVSPYLNQRITKKIEFKPVQCSNGWIVGYGVPDYECSDRKAVNRNPREFRFAYVNKSPAESERREVIINMEKLVANKSGENINMHIPVPSSLAILKNRGKFMSKKILIFAGLLIITPMLLFSTNKTEEVSACASRAWQKTIRTVKQVINGREVSKSASKMCNHLENWDSVDEDYSGTKTINSFFIFLVAPSTNSSHPDALFLKRLPDASPSKVDDNQPGKGEPWSVQDLNRELLSLADELQVDTSNDYAEENIDALQKQNHKLIDKIATKMDYENWVRTSGDFMVTGKNEPNKKVREKTLGFFEDINWYKDLVSAERDVVEKIYSLLSKWRVKEVVEADIKERPQFVVYCFFSFLSQEQLLCDRSLDEDDPLDKELLEEENSWPAAFARRLPKKSLLREKESSPRKILRQSTLDKLLGNLAEHIGSERGGNELATLNNIAVAMDYEEFTYYEGSINDLPEELKGRQKASNSKRINQFVHFFQQNTP